MRSFIAFSSPLSHPPPLPRLCPPPPSREMRGCISPRCCSLRSNLRAAGATRTNARCARREGIRTIFVSAHSRANAHPSSRDPSSALQRTEELSTRYFQAFLFSLLPNVSSIRLREERWIKVIVSFGYSAELNRLGNSRHERVRLEGWKKVGAV